MSPTIITFTSEIIDSNSIKLYWTGTYDTITLEKSINDSTFTTVKTSYSGSSYTFTGLNSNTVYYFRITPYDSSSTAGSSESLFAITPMSMTINTFYSGTTTTSSIPLYWSGSFYKVAIYYKRTVDTSYKLLATSAGTSSYNATNLSADTSYNFYITPYNLNNESGTSSSIITAYTDYTSYISDFHLGNITSSTVDLSWNGEFSFIKVQKSTDGGSHYVTDTKLIVYDNSSSEISSSGSCTISDLSPYTYYYFRIVPYSENHNVGTTSSVVYGRTLMGISTFSYDTPTVNSVTLSWTGIYTKVAVKKTYNNNTFTVATVTNDATDTTQTTSDSYTISNLSPYTSYTFFLLPYNNNTSTTKTSSATITTDFSAQINPYISNITYNSASILFDTSGATSPYYSYVLVEYSTDGGSTYSDLSYVSATTSSSSPYTYVAGDLSANTEYYFRATPYSLYDVAGSSTVLNTTTDGYISAAQIYLDSSSQIVVDFSGIYSYVRVKYGTDSSVSNGVVSTSENSYTFSSSVASSSSVYYFSIVPYNNADVSGDSYTTLYNPVVSTFYVSNSTSSTNTLVLSGNYTKVLIQQATRSSATASTPTTYTDVSFIDGSGVSSTNTITLSGASTSSAIYYRAIPYYNNYAGNDASGAATDALYVPIIDSISVNVNGQYDICLNWTGIYDYARIQYASYGSSTYYDICANYATNDTTDGNTYRITGSDRDFSGNSYKLRVIPYSYADSSNTIGIYNETYNASISSIDASANSTLASDINTTILYFSGYYDTVYIYFREDGASYGSEYIEITDGSTYASIGGLTTNTKYYFKIVPYNEDDLAGMTSQEDSVTTQSMLSGLDLSYSAANSSSTAVYFTWNDTGYTYFDVYDSADTFLQRYYSSGQTYYNSSGIETLSSNTTYTYTIYVYDSIGSTETTTISASTLSATSREINMTTLNYASGVTFTWDPVGYKEITIQNITTAAAPTIATDTPYYDSYSNEDSTYFLPNTQYTYAIQTTCDRGNIVKENKTITTAAELAFSVLYTTNNSVCIRVRGAYSGFAVYAGTDLEQMEVIERKLDVYPARTEMPTDLLYYYPFDTNLCDYSTGYALESRSAVGGGGGEIVQNESTVGLGCLYLSETGVKLPACECAPKTLAMWVNPSVAAESAKIFDFVSSTNSYRRWYLGMNGTLYYCYEDDGENIISTEMQIAPPPEQKWTHIAITVDGDTWSVYINGSLSETKSGCLEPQLMSTDYNYIGKSFIAHDEYYNGYIEDLRIYSRTLSADEIMKLYNMGFRDFTITMQPGATYYLQLAPQNGAGEYGELTPAQIVSL